MKGGVFGSGPATTNGTRTPHGSAGGGIIRVPKYPMPVGWAQGKDIACRGADTNLFYPVGTTGPADAQIKAAKAICARCEFREECLETALANGEEGIWGGLTDDERQKLRQERRHRRRSA